MQKQENHSQAAILGLQHLLAMYSGSILQKKTGKREKNVR